MGTLPFMQPDSPTGAFSPTAATTTNNSSLPFGGNFNFGQLPFNRPMQGGMDNGLNLAGAWASGGFNTMGATPTSGFQPFSGTGSGNTGSGSSSGQFGVVPFNFDMSKFTGPNMPQVSGKDLSKIYGKGIGNALQQFLNSGAGFNPQALQQLFQSQMATAMPIEERTTAKMMDIFGNSGNAYGSTAAIGIGDFESQFNAALQGQFTQEYSNMYEQSVQDYLNVLMGVKQDAKENAAQSPNFLSIAGDIAKSIIPFFS